MNTTTVLGSLGLHVHLNPAGTYSFVGRIPSCLGTVVKATPADCMGGRAFMSHGEAWTVSFPVFATREAAVDFAKAHGFDVAANLVVVSPVSPGLSCDCGEDYDDVPACDDFTPQEAFEDDGRLLCICGHVEACHTGGAL